MLRDQERVSSTLTGDTKSLIFLPGWCNWQTRPTQTRSIRGSNPLLGTMRKGRRGLPERDSMFRPGRPWQSAHASVCNW